MNYVTNIDRTDSQAILADKSSRKPQPVAQTKDRYMSSISSTSAALYTILDSYYSSGSTDTESTSDSDSDSASVETGA